MVFQGPINYKILDNDSDTTPGTTTIFSRSLLLIFGPLVYISTSGPNPIMVQPLPFQLGTSFGAIPAGTVQLGSGLTGGSPGSGFHPRNIDIRIRTGSLMPSATVDQREPADYDNRKDWKVAFKSTTVPLGDFGKNTEVNGKITNVKGGKTFANVVKQGRGEDISWLKVLVSEDGSDWLDRTMFVRLKSLSLVGRLETLMNNFNPNFSIRFGCGNIVLILFGSKVELDKDFSSVAVIIQDLCAEVRSWGEECALEPSRLVWLHCFGIPFYLWNLSTFQRIGNLWGDFIRVDSLDSKSLVCGRILVHTRVMESIRSMVYVECNNKQFAVSVLEGQVSTDFAEEMEQKWGLSLYAEHRSKSSVVGGRSKNTQRPEVAVGNDEERVALESVEDGISGSTVGVVNKVHSKANLQLRGGIKGRKNPLPVEPIRGVSRLQGQKSRHQLTCTKKGATLTAAIATFSLASSSKSDSSRGRIILNEAQASVQLGKALGIDFDAQEDVVRSKIFELERNDLARIEQRRNQQGR
ncbi:Ubiquitin-like domain-containing protein CIP73 [Camellia lanceoleosa]|uniref:Ubiquitin-like domain-containing protein CIP73 n=1 Tax=Camellia lanceoleosa TaxID=1840588 RepID=A0ACC0J355_9ERIC|nr:Ubiquitin-like domain-containing protein CIP73 [Camellia lanceoleosa]